MPKLPVTDADVVALSAYIRSLGAGAGPQAGK
jgi:cytochrome c oxidase subunit 2